MRTLRGFILGFLLGILVAFLAWALWWSFSGLRVRTAGMTGDVTVMNLRTSGSAPHDAALGRAFAKELSQAGVSVIVDPPREGPPGLVAWDPAGAVAWLPPGLNTVAGDRPAAWLFAGSYSAELWQRTGRAPLLPAGSVVRGVIPTPADLADTDLQFVVGLAQVAPPPGSYVLDTTDAATLQDLTDTLVRLGLEPMDTYDFSVFEYLRRQPLLIAVATMNALGMLAVATFLVLSWRSRQAETGVRARHRASVAAIAGRWWRETTLPLLAGLTLGAAVALGGTAAVTGMPLPQPLRAILAGIVTTAALGCAAGIAVTAWATARMRYDADVVA